ncbi:hypothetical protein K4F52_010353, partial [Lecanicillium sp. MT-2017a]
MSAEFMSSKQSLLLEARSSVSLTRPTHAPSLRSTGGSASSESEVRSMISIDPFGDAAAD